MKNCMHDKIKVKTIIGTKKKMNQRPSYQFLYVKWNFNASNTNQNKEKELIGKK
jgi:hypothetical protein